MNKVIANLNQKGFAWVRAGVDPAELKHFNDLFFSSTEHKNRAGARIPPDANPALEAHILSLPWAHYLSDAVGGPPTLVRAITFEKSLEAPWRVAFHRDRMVPVLKHMPGHGLEGASIKAGVPHIQADPATLAHMLAVRIHLDAADAGNGALRVIPGSHLTNFDDDEPVDIVPFAHKAVLCSAEPGDVLLMRPLVLHGSEKPSHAAPRRVLHLEWRGPHRLPGGLHWAR